ncbi:MAG: 16S rRNA (uracil(1498)-N(3))-methyltransferase [Luteibaculaceae bacterium]
MNLFYQEDLSAEQNQAILNEEESKHATKVLRMQVGSTVSIINGKGQLFTAILGPATGKKNILKITNCTHFPKTPYTVHVALAPTKNIDRFEWALEKMTEIGVDTITPILCHHNERSVIKPDRLEKILVSAIKQSKNYWKPSLMPITPLTEFLKSERSGEKLFAHCLETEKTALFTAAKNKKEITICIGPEGDFSDKEVQLALEQGYIPVDLGENRLRSETAAVFSLITILNALKY